MQRSLKLMRERGYRCYITEYHTRGFKHDLFGFADILCLKDDEVCVVQTTSRNNVNARIKKITDTPRAVDESGKLAKGIVASEEVAFVRKAGIRILVHGWGYLIRSKTYECREIDLS